jgi:hypothetical protein
LSFLEADHESRVWFYCHPPWIPAYAGMTTRLWLYFNRFDRLGADMRIEKKVLKKYFQLILDGKKTYELRLGDFECKEGDVLVLKEWDEDKKEYTGRVLEKTVTYVGKNVNNPPFWSKEEIEKHGLQIISF